MYENSIVPDRLPGGGGFSIKNITLQALYLEHTHGHNIFTSTNEPYPLMRYLGCQIKFFRSQDIDYIVSYNNQWPLNSNLKMYNSMQPQIHFLQKHRIIVTSKRTNPNKKKPYKKLFIPPPTQMKNQWYFQSVLANTPLFMLMTSSTSLDHWYIGTRSLSTNITIVTLNTSYIFHRNWDKPNFQYYCTTIGTQNVYLYALEYDVSHIINENPIANIVCLGNTTEPVPGLNFKEYKHLYSGTINDWKKPQHWGNPFHTDYLLIDPDKYVVLTSTSNIDQVASQISETDLQKKIKDTNLHFTPITMTENLRYNPYTDDGVNNKCYFLNCKEPQGLSWDDPHNPDLTNENLPLWLLLFGFSDFQKKIKKLKHIDTDYTFVIKTQKTTPLKLYVVPLGISFLQGNSPYEKKVNDADSQRWFPSFQMQQESYNDICLSGPGTPHIPPGITAEAKLQYTFFFKWGGELPDMALIENPSEKPSYPVPNNFFSTTSLQNPTRAPEHYLYSFDQRRDIITQKAAKRMRKDFTPEKYPLSITEPRFGETAQTQTTQTPTTSEEEEEETLYEQLQQQRQQQKLLKQRIRLTLQQMQNIE